MNRETKIIKKSSDLLNMWRKSDDSARPGRFQITSLPGNNLPVLNALSSGNRAGNLVLISRAQYCSTPARLWPREYSDRKSTRLNSSHVKISYAVFCLKKKRNYFTRYI